MNKELILIDWLIGNILLLLVRIKAAVNNSASRLWACSYMHCDFAAAILPAPTFPWNNYHFDCIIFYTLEKRSGQGLTDKGE